MVGLASAQMAPCPGQKSRATGETIIFNVQKRIRVIVQNPIDITDNRGIDNPVTRFVIIIRFARARRFRTAAPKWVELVRFSAIRRVARRQSPVCVFAFVDSWSGEQSANL